MLSGGKRKEGRGKREEQKERSPPSTALRALK